MCVYAIENNLNLEYVMAKWLLLIIHLIYIPLHYYTHTHKNY